MRFTIRRILFLVGLVGLVVAWTACEGRADRDVPPAARAAATAVDVDAASTDAPGYESADGAAAVGEVVTVYKSASCGCCKAWVAHMEEAGFTVEAHDVDDLPAVKVEHGVRPEHQSCHTALVGGYVVEGHVPADVVRRMLDERPAIAGLATPGMPRGSPGMEVPSGERDAYDVIAFRDDGTSEVYATPWK